MSVTVKLRHHCTNTVGYDMYQKVIIVKEYHKNGNSIMIVQRKFWMKIGSSPSPKKNLIIG